MCTLRIKELCKAKGHTMQWLAKEIGYRHPSSFYQALGRGIDVNKLESIANALNVPITALFEASTEAMIVCPHCGQVITLKTEKI